MIFDSNSGEPFGYFAGWIDEKKRIGRVSFKSYPDIKEQKLSYKERRALR